MSPSSETQARVSLVDAARTAGYVDSEGCITGSACLASNGARYGHAGLNIRNKDKRLMDWLLSTWGGVVKDKGCIYEWRPNEQTGNLLKQIRTFLHVKRRQAEVLLAFVSLPEIAPKKRLRLAAKLQRLNDPYTCWNHLPHGKIHVVDVQWTPKVPKTFLAYTAAFLDGDGKIGSDGQLRFYNCNVTALQNLQKYWGGTLARTPDPPEMRSPYFYLAITRSDRKLRLLNLVRPYVLLKGEVADKLMDVLREKI